MIATQAGKTVIPNTWFVHPEQRGTLGISEGMSDNSSLRKNTSIFKYNCYEEFELFCQGLRVKNDEEAVM